MNNLQVCLAAILLGISGLSFAATDDGEGDEFTNGDDGAEIFAAALGGIRNFNVVDDSTLIVEGRNNNRYRIELFGRCPGLRFQESLLFLTGPGGNLNRFSSLYVDGARCPFRSIQKISEGAAADINQ